MIIGWINVINTYKARRKGNMRAFVYVDFKSFKQGYTLFVPLMTAEQRDAKKFFMFPSDYK